MKILAINNYSLKKSLYESKNNISPAHHTWGVDYLIECGHNVDIKQFKNPVGNAFMQHLKLWLWCLKNLDILRKYDVVISFFNPLLGFAAFLKKVGFLKNVHLYTMVHHLTHFPELNSGYEKIFFISSSILEFAKERYPALSDKMVYLEWGPDLKFYEQSYIKCRRRKGTLCNTVIISTGKTLRDLDILEKVCKEIHLSVIIITDNIKMTDYNIVQSGNVGKNAITYSSLLEYLEKSNINVIPCQKKIGRNTICGLTSFLDALAMGQPIIMSDNTNISVDIEGLGIGYIYRAGNKDDLKAKLKVFLDIRN